MKKNRCALWSIMSAALFLAATPATAAARTASPQEDNRAAVPLLSPYFNIFYSTSPHGHIKVRENEFKGTWLSLSGDLGMESLTGLEAGCGFRLFRSGMIDLSYTQYLYRGTAVLASDVFFNGSILEGGSKVNVSDTSHHRISLMYRHFFAPRDRDYLVKVSAGLVYDYLIFEADANISPLSPGTEVTEGFNRQAIPIPALGIGVERPLAAKTDFLADLEAAYLPGLYTGFQEGGDVTVWQYDLDATVGVRLKSGSWVFDVGYRYMLFAMLEKSREDTNDILLEASGLSLRATLSI